MRDNVSKLQLFSRLRSRGQSWSPPASLGISGQDARSRPEIEVLQDSGVWRGVDAVLPDLTADDPRLSGETANAGDPHSVPVKSVTIVLTSTADLHRVPYLLPSERYYVCQVIIVEDRHSDIDVATWTLLNDRGVLVQFSPAFLLEANTGLDSILSSASGDLIVALDSYRCDDQADVMSLLEGDRLGFGFMKDYVILGGSSNESDLSYGRREAAVASRFSSKHGTPIRDFGVGSFAVRRELVDEILRVDRLQAGLGSPMGRHALASLALAASTAKLSIYESAVYACERIITPLDMEFIDQIGPVPVRLSNPVYRPNDAVARTLR